MKDVNVTLICFVVVSLGGCAQKNFESSRESAEMSLIKIVGNSGNNACTKLISSAGFRADYDLEGKWVEIHATESGRIQQSYKKRCYKILKAELKKVRLKIPQIKLRKKPHQESYTP